MAQKDPAKETKIKELKEDIETREQELEYFTYAVSHDLKSPLVTLAGFSSIISHYLSKESGCSDKNKEIILDAAEEIQKATKNLSSTIDSILHLSRIGRIYMEKSLVCTEEIVEEVVALNAIRIKNQGVKINNVSNLNVFVQREIFISIIQNLLTNSLDHAQKENETLCIDINFESCSCDCFFIHYKDNGKGMTENQIENLFDYSNREFAKGFGVMIIKKGVEYHHGEIDISSQPHTGTEFRIKIKQK